MNLKEELPSSLYFRLGALLRLGEGKKKLISDAVVANILSRKSCFGSSSSQTVETSKSTQLI